MRNLLDRLDDSKDGMAMKELQTELPAYARPEAERMVKLYGKEMMEKYKMEPGVEYCSQEDQVEMYLNNTWRANL